jgi:Leucine-rich repeat (LRR) protein
VAPPALPLLSQLTRLEGVELETQFPNPSAAREYLHQLPAIAPLLRGLHIGSIRNKDLELIGGLRQLEVLRIQCSEIRDYAFAPLSQLEQLRELTLSQNPKLLGTGLARVPAGGLQLLDVAEIGGSFESDGAKRLGAATCRAIARFRDLKELTLSLNYFEPGATQPLEALTSLETLNAMSCGWSAADLKFLTSLRGLKRLRLNGNPLDDSAAHTLRRLDALEELWLKDSKVTDASIEVLVGLPQLRELGLCRTRVTDQGVAALARARSLRRLSIDGGEITERALSHLTALPLRELDIGRKCKVSKSARDALTKALPGCTVREAW